MKFNFVKNSDKLKIKGLSMYLLKNLTIQNHWYLLFLLIKLLRIKFSCKRNLILCKCYPDFIRISTQPYHQYISVILATKIPERCEPKCECLNPNHTTTTTTTGSTTTKNTTTTGMKQPFFLNGLPEIYIQSAPNNSNETYIFMCLGRAGCFGQC